MHKVRFLLRKRLALSKTQIFSQKNFFCAISSILWKIKDCNKTQNMFMYVFRYAENQQFTWSSIFVSKISYFIYKWKIVIMKGSRCVCLDFQKYIVMLSSSCLYQDAISMNENKFRQGSRVFTVFERTCDSINLVKVMGKNERKNSLRNFY